jgi:hypothetical protein
MLANFDYTYILSTWIKTYLTVQFLANMLISGN